MLPQAADDVAGGTPAIGGAAGIADWSQPGGNAANAPGNVSLAGASGAASWRVPVVEKASKRNVRPSVPPLVYGGRIFVYDASGTVSVAVAGRRQGTGRSRSRRRARRAAPPAAASPPPARRSSRRPASASWWRSTRRPAIALWAFKLSAPAHSAPTASGGKVFVVSATNVLHAVNQADGTEAWQYPGIPETAGVLSSASPAVSGDTVVVPYSSGEVIAFDTDDRRAEMGRRGDPLDAHARRVGPDRRGGEPGHLRRRRLRDRRVGPHHRGAACRRRAAVGAEHRQRVDAGRLRQRDLHRRPRGQHGRARPGDRQGVLADGAAGRAQEEILLRLGRPDACRQPALGGVERRQA